MHFTWRCTLHVAASCHITQYQTPRAATAAVSSQRGNNELCNGHSKKDYNNNNNKNAECIQLQPLTRQEWKWKYIQTKKGLQAAAQHNTAQLGAKKHRTQAPQGHLLCKWLCINVQPIQTLAYVCVWRFVKSSRPIRVLGLKASPNDLANAMIAAVAPMWQEKI